MSTILLITLPISGSLPRPLVDYLETLRLSKPNDKDFDNSIDTIIKVLLVISNKTSKSTILIPSLGYSINAPYRLYSRLPYLYIGLR